MTKSSGCDGREKIFVIYYYVNRYYTINTPCTRRCGNRIISKRRQFNNIECIVYYNIYVRIYLSYMINYVKKKKNVTHFVR